MNWITSACWSAFTVGLLYAGHHFAFDSLFAFAATFAVAALALTVLLVGISRRAVLGNSPGSAETAASRSRTAYPSINPCCT